MRVTRENIVWEKHQKQVPTVDDEGGKLWGCFRSCFLQSAAPYTEGVAYKILKDDLGMDLREAAGHTSCGAIGYHGDVTTIETQMVVAARNFSVAHHELGVDNLFSFCVTSFANPKNYFEWLVLQFGEYFTANFPGIYTKKYWTIPANEMTIDWLGNRFSLPPLDKLLKGAFEEQKENFYYAQTMRYPIKGGYKSFLQKMAANTNIKTNKEVVLIDLKTKRIEFADGTTINYEKLVSSIPLPELLKCIKDVPKSIMEASEKLLCTSGQLVSIGFNKPDITKNIWFYMYDEDIIPSRAYSPSIKSPDNVPENCSSLQFETFYSSKKKQTLKGDALLEHIINKGEKMGIFTKNDILIADYREQKYANVVFDFERKQNVELIHTYLNNNQIKYIGRFGEWDYLWSDQSLLSGKNVLLKFI